MRKENKRYWLYDPEGEGLMFFETEEERGKAAAEIILEYANDFEGWSEGVEGICAGVVTHLCQPINVKTRPDDLDDDDCDGGGEYWDEGVIEKCDYALLPLEEEESEQDIIRAFVERVEREAEENMLKTGRLEGAHYAAMKRVLVEMEEGRVEVKP